jgi:hypothetical protein
MLLYRDPEGGYARYLCVRHELTQAPVKFIARAKSNLVYAFERALIQTATVRDSLVWVRPENTSQLVRLVEVLYRGTWYRYLSNELGTQRLPAAYLVALYWQCWRIEDAYAIVKFLLGLAYFWCDTQNARGNSSMSNLAALRCFSGSHRQCP